MGRGNPNARGTLGNKGGGRKSAYQEHSDAAELQAIFRDPKKVEVIKQRVASGTYSIKDIMILKALGGNERFIAEMFKKLYPDLERIEHSGGINIQVMDYAPKGPGGAEKISK